MSSAMDVLDILDIDESSPKKTFLDKEALLARTEKRKVPRPNAPPKRPEHVPREVWGLHSTLYNELPPIMPTNDAPIYRQPKAVIGVGRVRRWYWVPFTNSARKDNLILHHWSRDKPDSQVQTDYHFARYDVHVTIPEYTHQEYETLLKDCKWPEDRTEHLMQLAKRFDLRFVHMRDRWDTDQFPGRPSVEDLKERYYGIVLQLDKARGTNLGQGLRYDGAHERRRKQQLSLLYGRTKDQVEEEQRLIVELRKIENRRKERERKKQDLQKLIMLADMNVGRESDLPDMTLSGFEPGSVFDESAGGLVNQRKRSSSNIQSLVAGGADSSATTSNNDVNASLTSASSTATSALNTNYVINFLDLSKTPGAHLRSQKMKLPSNLGQKKIRIIENILAHLQIDPSPPATAEIVEAYDNLRSKLLLLFDLRVALLHCDYELHSARMRLETFAPNRILPPALISLPNPGSTESDDVSSVDPDLLAALRVADSKRPILPRHSLGVAGTLAAAAGTLGQLDSVEEEEPMTTTMTSVPQVSPNPDSDNVVNDSTLQRRRRAAAVEQGRVLKKLKIKGQLVD